MSFTNLESGRVVYDTGKVLIGRMARPAPPEIGSEAERVQTALLQPIEVGRRSWLWHVVHFFIGPR